MNTTQILAETNEILLYTTPNGDVKVEVFLHNENLWLTQKKMAELFDVNIPAISKHLNNIYEEDELQKSSTVSILETVQNEGKITHEEAKEKAFAEYDIFNKTQSIESDFDREVKKLLEIKSEK